MWPESSASSSLAITGIAEPSPKRRLRSFWSTTTNSRKLVPSALVIVAAARLSRSSAQVEPSGSITMAPTRPLLVCLIGSAGISAVAPNSTGVATRSLFGSSLRSPAYQK